MEFRIFKEFKDRVWSEADKKYYESPYTNYCLVDNNPEFFGTGNFCGYYGKSGYMDGHIISETKITYIETDEDLTFSIAIISGLDYYRDIADTYSCPVKFEADDYDKAFAFFEDIVKNQLFDKLKEILK